MVFIAPHVRAGGIGISWFRTCVRKVAVCNPLSISELLKLLAAKREQGVLANCCELMCYVPPHPSGNEMLKQVVDLALLANGMLKGKDLSDFIARSAKVVEDAYLK